MDEISFGFTLGTVRSAAQLTEMCQVADGYGFTSASVVDHLGPGRMAPFATLVAAALVAPRLRVGTFVANVGFYNAALLAREVVSAVRLTGGRLDLGLGIGLIKAEFDAAGIAFHGFDQRRAALLAAIEEIDRLVEAEGDLEWPPLMIGGTGERVLRMAAEQADIVSFAGLHQLPGRPPGSFRLASAADATRQTDFVRSVSAGRATPVRLNNFVKIVEVTDDRAEVAAKLAAAPDDYLTIGSAELALSSPFLLIGTADQIAGQIIADRDRYGFTSITVQKPYLHVLGPIISRVRALSRAGT